MTAYCTTCGVSVPKGGAYKFCPECGTSLQLTRRGRYVTRSVATGIGIAFVLLLAGFLATPFVIVHQMKVAAENHDGAALSEHVDFTAFRQSLKDQLNVLLAEWMAEEVDKGNNMAPLGGMIGGVVLEKMIDNYVTPVGLTALMNGEKPGTAGIGSDSSEQATAAPFSGASVGYQSFGKFLVILHRDDLENQTVFVFRRSGLSWKLTEIVLPL